MRVDNREGTYGGPISYEVISQSPLVHQGTRHAHPDCSQPAVSSLVGLVILATIAPATPSFRHIRASQKEPVLLEGPQDGPKSPSLVKDEERALAEFLDTYRLAPGQNLKRIPPPRPNGVRVWYGRKGPRPGEHR